MRRCATCGAEKGDWGFLSRASSECVQCVGRAASAARKSDGPDVTVRCDECNKKFRVPATEVQVFRGAHVCDPAALKRRRSAIDAAHGRDDDGIERRPGLRERLKDASLMEGE